MLHRTSSVSSVTSQTRRKHHSRRAAHGSNDTSAVAPRVKLRQPLGRDEATAAADGGCGATARPELQRHRSGTMKGRDLATVHELRDRVEAGELVIPDADKGTKKKKKKGRKKKNKKDRRTALDPSRRRQRRQREDVHRSRGTTRKIGGEEGEEEGEDVDEEDGRPKQPMRRAESERWMRDMVARRKAEMTEEQLAAHRASMRQQQRRQHQPPEGTGSRRSRRSRGSSRRKGGGVQIMNVSVE